MIRENGATATFSRGGNEPNGLYYLNATPILTMDEQKSAFSKRGSGFTAHPTAFYIRLVRDKTLPPGRFPPIAGENVGVADKRGAASRRARAV